MGSIRPFLSRLRRLPVWCLRQPREWWLVHRAVRRCRATAARPATPRLAVLVSERVSPRICKIGYGLKSLGWKTVLLHRRAPPADPGRCFDELRRFESPAEALCFATEYRPVVYHVFANWHFDVATLFIRHRPGKVVFDNYDVLVGTLVEKYNRIYRREIGLERFCLENADGLCCRDLQMQCAKRAGYRLRGRRVLLYDYCWGNHAPAPVARAEPVAGFHVASCGNIPIGTPGEWSIHQEELTRVARTLLAQGLVAPSVHFHLYPTEAVWPGAIRSGAAAGVAIGQVPVSFHVHAPVAPDELQTTLQQYDAGLYHVGVGANPPTYNAWKFVYTSGNRVFDYLDAGLPVVIHGSNLMELLVRRVRADIRLEAQLTAEARQFLRREDRGVLRRHAIAGSASLAIARHIPKLAAFYETLS